MTTKKEVLNYLISEIQELLPISIVKSHKKAEAIRFELPQDCKIEFVFLSVLGGSKGKNSFVINFSMTLFNPLLSEVMYKPLGIDQGNDPELVAHLGSLNNLPKEIDRYSRYMFCQGEDNQLVADRLIADIKKYFIPYVKPLLYDYDLLLENYNDPSFVKQLGKFRQFIIGVAAAILSKKEDAIESLIVPLAERSTEEFAFREYRKAIDYKTELVDPIRQYVYENKLI